MKQLALPCPPQPLLLCQGKSLTQRIAEVIMKWRERHSAVMPMPLVDYERMIKVSPERERGGTPVVIVDCEQYRPLYRAAYEDAQKVESWPGAADDYAGLDRRVHLRHRAIDFTDVERRILAHQFQATETGRVVNAANQNLQTIPRAVRDRCDALRLFAFGAMYGGSFTKRKFPKLRPPLPE